MAENKIEGFDFRDRVHGDMMKMYREGSFNDVNIKLHDGEIKANKSVLAARCEYFAATFRWKNNNYHDVEEILVNDCSKKIMTRIIVYIFSGVLEVKDLNILEFLELKDQVRKMFPGDELVGRLEHFFERSKKRQGILDALYFCISEVQLTFPTYEQIVKALSLVESENLSPNVIAALKSLFEKETSLWGYEEDEDLKQLIAFEANLCEVGVIQSIKHLPLFQYEDRSEKYSPMDLGFVPRNRLQELVSCVTNLVEIVNVTSDLTRILDSVKSKELCLTQKLNQEETEALVRAMSSRVQIVHLLIDSEEGLYRDEEYRDESVGTRLDFETFKTYQRDGTCREIHITNYCLTDYDMTTLLDSVSCKELHLTTMQKRLNQKETEALVRAMTSRVEIVHLGEKKSGYFANLHFDTLNKYDGQGTCNQVVVHRINIGGEMPDGSWDGIMGDLGDEEAETWAKMMGWDLKGEGEGRYLLSREKQVDLIF